MTDPLTPQWSWRTLVAGSASFLGLFLAALAASIDAMPNAFGVGGLILAALGQAYNGWVARDDRVSSTGHIAAKDRE